MCVQFTARQGATSTAQELLHLRAPCPESHLQYGVTEAATVSTKCTGQGRAAAAALGRLP